MFSSLSCSISQKWSLSWFKILRMISRKRNDVLHPLYRLGDVAWLHPSTHSCMTKAARALLSQGGLKSKVILVLGFTALIVIYHASLQYQCLANIYLLYFASFSMKSYFGWIYWPKASHVGSLVLSRHRSALLSSRGCISIPLGQFYVILLMTPWHYYWDWLTSPIKPE